MSWHLATRWLVAVLALATLWGPLPAAPLAVQKALELPGMRALLPAGTATGASTTGPAAVKAWALRASLSGDPLRVAVLVTEAAPPSSGPKTGAGRTARLVVARQQGKALVSELALKEAALGVHLVVLERVRPAGGAALAVHWASSVAGHGGKLEIWALGAGAPSLALRTITEGFYFDAPGAGGAPLVLYEPEEDSVVCLPSVYEWQGERLVPAKSGQQPLAKRLLGEYDEVLDAFAASGPGAVPNRMVMDVGLQKGRLLEREGNKSAARAAYERVASLLSALSPKAKLLPADRAALEERAAEARRRAQGLQ